MTANASCWRCLLRPSIATSRQAPHLPIPLLPPSLPQTQTTVIASFSTTASSSAAAKKGGNAKLSTGRRGWGANKKSGPQASSGARRIQPGERKAMRKRIVLSNTNALPVPELWPLESTDLQSEGTVGRIVSLPGPVVDVMRTVGAFKPNQAWSFFRDPAMLMRRESVELARHVEEVMEKAAEGSGEKHTLRRVYIGARGTGKSMMLCQGIAMAAQKKWFVLNIGEAQELTMSHTAYEPAPNTSDPMEYVHPIFSLGLLQQLINANKPLFTKLSVSQFHDLPTKFTENSTLEQLAELGTKDSALAWPVLQALFKEMTAPSTEKHVRPPMLVAMDGLASFSRPTDYRDADFKLIHPLHFQLINHLLGFLSGERKLGNGGIVLAAPTMSSPRRAETMELALRQALARKTESEVPIGSLFKKYDESVAKIFENVDVVELAGTSRDETKGLLEYYARSGVIRAYVNRRYINEKWTLSGGGVIKELERATLRYHS